MPIPRSALANTVTCATPTVADTRWLLSYAAAVGDGDNPFYMRAVGPAVQRRTHDFHGSGIQGSGVMAHPLFVWAVEWPILWRQAGTLLLAPRQGSGETGLASAEQGRGLHYSQDIIIHRPISANDAIVTDCTLVTIRRRERGTFVKYRFDHRIDGTRELLCTTWNGTYFRGVEVSGAVEGQSEWLVRESLPPHLFRREQQLRQQQGTTAAPPRWTIQIQIEAHFGIVFAECSRIWNPIHSDPAAAKASGLVDGPILHGTATLAKSVSALVRKFTAGNDPAAVQRVSVQQFGAPVRMPSVLTLEVNNVDVRLSYMAIHFVVKTSRGGLAIRGGCVVLRAIGGRLSSSLLQNALQKQASQIIRLVDPTNDRDLDAVRKLFAQGMRFYSDRMPVSPLRLFWEEYIDSALEDDLADISGVYLKPGGAFWVVVVEGTIVGMVAVEVVDKHQGVMELRRMSVAPCMKRSGLGSRLIGLVEDFAANHGAREIVLTTGSLMAPARALYLRNGFEPHRVEPRTTAAMRAAGQSFSIVSFRKPVTSARGRWTWTPRKSSL